MSENKNSQEIQDLKAKLIELLSKPENKHLLTVPPDKEKTQVNKEIQEWAKQESHKS